MFGCGMCVLYFHHRLVLKALTLNDLDHVEENVTQILSTILMRLSIH